MLDSVINRLGHNMDGIEITHESHPICIEPYWIRIDIDGDNHGNIIHLSPSSATTDTILAYSNNWPSGRLIDANGIIIERKLCPYVVSSIITDGMVVMLYSEKFFGVINLGIEQMKNKLIFDFIAKWPDRRMGGTNIWMGPYFNESGLKTGLDCEILAQLAIVKDHRPIQQVSSAASLQQILHHGNTMRKRCAVVLHVKH